PQTSPGCGQLRPGQPGSAQQDVQPLSPGLCPQVVESGILDMLPAEERKRQEAIFEILTSEFSYQHSLGILVSEFLQCRELQAAMTQTERHHLFSNILDVRSASQRFFEDLERRHKEQVCVEDISDILEEHAERHFHPYVAYCANEVYQ
ncbi:rho guanine nucleotide exchange factor 16-like, partial [Pteropus vampyrus]|uniref:Rho guanine nucleotide exchange factor 16-like n=1 Tax=Pteropus vampyrus TaxID=132908 RepID=A0A6P6C5Y1_PTEVA